MCNVAPACKRDGAMACQAPFNDPTSVYDLAFPNDDVAPHFWTWIPGGIQLDAFGSGLYCQYEGNERKSIVQVYCNPNVTSAPKNFSNFVVEGPPCTYTMTISHSAGCGGPIPQTSTVTPVVSSSTDQSTVTGAGIGVGIIIGIALTVAAGATFIWVKRRTRADNFTDATTDKRGTTGANKWNKFEDDKINMSTIPGTETGSTDETS